MAAIMRRGILTIQRVASITYRGDIITQQGAITKQRIIAKI